MTTKTPKTKGDHPHAFSHGAHTGWRSRVRDYTPLIGSDNQTLLDEVLDRVYDIVLRTGANLKTICDYFGWDINTARLQLQPVIDMAKAELKLTILQNQIEFGLSTKQPLAKIHIGRQHADQLDYAVPETLANGQTAGGLFDGLTVVVTHRDMDGRTLEAPTYMPVVRAVEAETVPVPRDSEN